jgi:hypothetical protein
MKAEQAKNDQLYEQKLKAQKSSWQNIVRQGDNQFIRHNMASAEH